jgi:hypothetical protein
MQYVRVRTSTGKDPSPRTGGLDERATQLESAIGALEIQPDAETFGGPEIDAALTRARA